MHTVSDDPTRIRSARGVDSPRSAIVPRRSRRRARRGFSLLMVMVAISLSLVLTYSFLQSQTTTLQISRNNSRRAAALQAAQTGAAVALQRMQSDQWDGVDVELSQTLESDSFGTTAYRVRFLPLTATPDRPLALDAALHCVVWSTGIWEAADNPDERMEGYVRVVVRLTPRVPDGDAATVDTDRGNDVAENPAAFDEIQKYALFAEKQSKSLTLDPGDRIDGNIWLGRELNIYNDPHWSNKVRKQVLTDLAELTSNEQGRLSVRHPHPIGGTVTFQKKPKHFTRDDLTQMGIPWNEAKHQLQMPSFQFDALKTYRLYQGGFEYKAVTSDSYLKKDSLTPTPDNPLGIFYRRGDVHIDDQVTIQGTLVVDGTVEITGQDITISAFNWRGTGGQSIAKDSERWPRLPAIIAKNVRFDRDVRVLVDGPIAVAKNVTGAGGSFEYQDVTDLSLSGTAEDCRPIEQPYSIVQLEKSANLNALPTDPMGEYAVWLQDGVSGGWHPIKNVDAKNHRLTVLGEVAQTSPTTYRIRPSRSRFVDIRGPVCGEQHDINRLPEWDLSHDLWEERLDQWKEDVEMLEAEIAAGKSTKTPPSFIDWLADPSHFAGWHEPYNKRGLSLEPTFHLRPAPGRVYHWAPPLFAPCDERIYGSELAGYRWEVIEWQEIRDTQTALELNTTMANLTATR